MLSAGDFNKDGKLDLVAVCGVQPTVWFLPGLGTGQFGPPISTTLPQPTVDGWIDGYFNNFAVADFNGDGALDLIWSRVFCSRIPHWNWIWCQGMATARSERHHRYFKTILGAPS